MAMILICIDPKAFADEVVKLALESSEATDIAELRTNVDKLLGEAEQFGNDRKLLANMAATIANGCNNPFSIEADTLVHRARDILAAVDRRSDIPAVVDQSKP